VPSAPPAEVAAQAGAVPAAVMERTKELFEERPIWNRTALEALLPKDHGAPLRLYAGAAGNGGRKDDADAPRVLRYNGGAGLPGCWRSTATRFRAGRGAV